MKGSRKARMLRGLRANTRRFTRVFDMLSINFHVFYEGGVWQPVILPEFLTSTLHFTCVFYMHSSNSSCFTRKMGPGFESTCPSEGNSKLAFWGHVWARKLVNYEVYWWWGAEKHVFYEGWVRNSPILLSIFDEGIQKSTYVARVEGEHPSFYSSFWHVVDQFPRVLRGWSVTTCHFTWVFDIDLAFYLCFLHAFFKFIVFYEENGSRIWEHVPKWG
jgi:hypothetical protein